MKPAEIAAHARNQQKTESRSPRPAQRECLALTDLADSLLDAYESVTNRAHDKYLARGAAPGRDFDDWLEAEREVLPEVHADFEESEKFIYALADVPEFAGLEISVAVEPRWLLILARSDSEEKSEPSGTGVEAAPKQRFSIYELSAQVERLGTVAVLSEGLLAIRMPKSAKF